MLNLLLINKITIIIILFSLALNAQTSKKANLIDSVETKVIEWRRDFHQNPKLSNREFETSKKFATHLKSLGMEVQTEIAHTGVVSILKGRKTGYHNNS